MRNYSQSINVFAAALILAVIYGAPAWAAPDVAMRACRADWRKLCPSVQPGGGRIAACLKQHEADLAPACKAALGTVGECGQQIKQICGTEVSASGGVRDCLRVHADEFSAACRATLSGQ